MIVTNLCLELWKIFFTAYQKFNLEPGTGRITLKEIIAPTQSAITQFQYLLEVIAVDDGSCCGRVNQRTSTGTLTVNILTDNENRPRFESCQTYTPRVDEGKADALVIQVINLTAGLPAFLLFPTFPTFSYFFDNFLLFPTFSWKTIPTLKKSLQKI